MELPAEVLIHNEALGLKGGGGTLVRISAEGYYEVNCQFGQRLHRVLLPIASTVLICGTPEENFDADLEIER